MPRVVRNVLLISVAASVAVLGLLGIVHMLDGAMMDRDGPTRHPAETEREPAAPAAIPLRARSAAG
ncbi:hypothetical protein WBP06_13395 [Novosphingobium sp. BL-8H]|uniref:hypothetical protein n=1 Tax=Novosphingobium sp. BL-8H TaxID=3127640 RepID=UPI003756C5C9